MPKKLGRPRDDAGSMLATVIVIGVGAGLCSLLCLLIGGSGADMLLLSVAFCTAILLLVCVVRLRRGTRSPNTGLSFWLALTRSPPDDGIAAQYRPRKVIDDCTVQPSGMNQPISAEEAHEIQITSAQTWVPSRNRNPEVS